MKAQWWIAILLLAGVATDARAQTQTKAQQRAHWRRITDAERQEARAALDVFTSPTLTRFQDEAEFRRYVAAARRGSLHFRCRRAEPGNDRAGLRGAGA